MIKFFNPITVNTQFTTKISESDTDGSDTDSDSSDSSPLSL